MLKYYFITILTIQSAFDDNNVKLCSCVLNPQVVLISFLLSIFVRKTKVKGVDDLDLRLILQVNKDYGVKTSKRETWLLNLEFIHLCP